MIKSSENNQQETSNCWWLLGLTYFNHEEGGSTLLQKRRLTLTGILGITSQKIIVSMVVPSAFQFSNQMDLLT
jgi:hypothetical protein